MAPCKPVFAPVAFYGRLYAQGILDNCPWNPAKLVYWDESQIDLINERLGDRKVRTVAELEVVLSKSRLGLPSLRIWVMEGLESEARKLRPQRNAERS